MKEFYVCVQQLDLALEQLRRGDPSYDRFAIVLIDNAVELMLHAQCEAEFLLDHGPTWNRDRKYEAGTRRRVLGQHFEEKNNFCAKIDKTTQGERDFIAACHSYRNELYHSGLKHDDIIHSIAWHYFKLTCELLRKFRPLPYALSSLAEAPAAVRRHAGDALLAMALHRGELEHTVADSLTAGLPPLPEALPTTLSRAADSRIDDVERDLAFLISENPRQMNETETIADIQFRDYTENENSEGKIDYSKIRTPRELRDELQRLRASWTPSHRVNPIPSWRSRAQRIQRDKSPLGALKKFESLRRDMSYFAGVAREAAFQLDGWIQDEIDRTRGK